MLLRSRALFRPLSGGFKTALPAQGFLGASRVMRGSTQLKTPTPGMPLVWSVSYDRPVNVERDFDWEIMPRDSFGVPAHIPPDLSNKIMHTYAVPPEYYPVLKRFGDENPSIKDFMDKLIAGKLTYEEYEEMFYKASKPLQVNRKRFPLPWRSEAEEKLTDVVGWESALYSFQQRVWGEYLTAYFMTDFLVSLFVGLWAGQILITQCVYYREDMKLFYVEAPEHKINWIVPRGDL